MKDVNVVLADHSGLGRVTLCECSSIHLSVGPVTLNLEPSAFWQMALLIRKAADKLSLIQEASETPKTLLDMLGSSPSRMTH